MNVKEGLICPQCLQTFDKIKVLQNHFSLCQIENSNFSKDQTGVVAMVRKAKKTVEDVLNSQNTELFLRKSNMCGSPFDQLSPSEQIGGLAFYEEPNIKFQPTGVITSRTQEFIKLRRMKLQCIAIETSNLILRLEKMLSFSENESTTERKNFERSIVEWAEDDLVPMCPSCGSKFGFNLSIKSCTDNPIVLSSVNEKGLATKKSSKLINAITNLINFDMETHGSIIKKKHHCRLCGGLICSNCSYMLPSTEANRLLAAINSRLDLRESLWQGSSSLTWKEDSEASLDSIKSKIKNKEYCIRCCGNCKTQIESKWIQMEKRTLEFDVSIMYKELIMEINKTTDLISQYQTISLSICNGETVYSYHKASEMRMDIVKRCQQIDAFGNQFKNLTSKSMKETTLFNSISRNVYLFLQNYFATLKYLPSEFEYKVLVNEKLMRLREETNTENRNKSLNDHIKCVTQSDLSGIGWAPSIKAHAAVIKHQTSNLNEVENTELDNVALQIDNVRRYIDQARESNRIKDVEILQKNMIDLENEYEALQKKLYA